MASSKPHVLSARRFWLLLAEPAHEGLSQAFGRYLSVGWLKGRGPVLPRLEISAEFRPLIDNHVDRAEEERRDSFGRLYFGLGSTRRA